MEYPEYCYFPVYVLILYINIIAAIKLEKFCADGAIPANGLIRRATKFFCGCCIYTIIAASIIIKGGSLLVTKMFTKV